MIMWGYHNRYPCNIVKYKCQENKVTNLKSGQLVVRSIDFLKKIRIRTKVRLFSYTPYGLINT